MSAQNYNVSFTTPVYEVTIGDSVTCDVTIVESLLVEVEFSAINNAVINDHVHTQLVASSTWTISHNLGYRPNVSVLTDGGKERIAEVIHISNNITQISFATATTGSARFI